MEHAMVLGLTAGGLSKLGMTETLGNAGQELGQEVKLN